MTISLSPKTQKLLEEQMEIGGYSSPDDVVRIALETLDKTRIDNEELDDEAWAAIDRAESQFKRGEGIPLDQTFEQLRRKHFGNETDPCHPPTA